MTRDVEIWYGDGNRKAEVTVAIYHMPRNDDPDDGPEYEIRKAVDKETKLPVELTPDEEHEAFSEAVA